MTGGESFQRDRRLWVWACRKPGPKRSSEEMVGEPVGGITCETDIFRVLGLAYMPPHRRFFHNFQ